MHQDPNPSLNILLQSLEHQQEGILKALTDLRNDLNSRSTLPLCPETPTTEPPKKKPRKQAAKKSLKTDSDSSETPPTTSPPSSDGAEASDGGEVTLDELKKLGGELITLNDAVDFDGRAVLLAAIKELGESNLTGIVKAGKGQEFKEAMDYDIERLKKEAKSKK